MNKNHKRYAILEAVDHVIENHIPNMNLFKDADTILKFKSQSDYALFESAEQNKEKLQNVNSLIVSIKSELSRIYLLEKSKDSDISLLNELDEKIQHYNHSLQELNIDAVNKHKSYTIQELLQVLKNERQHLKEQVTYPTDKCSEKCLPSELKNSATPAFLFSSMPYSTGRLSQELNCKKEDLTLSFLESEKRLFSSKLDSLVSKYKYWDVLHNRLSSNLTSQFNDHLDTLPIDNVSDDYLTFLAEDAIYIPQKHNALLIATNLEKRLKEIIPAIDKCCEKIQLIEQYALKVERSKQFYHETSL